MHTARACRDESDEALMPVAPRPRRKHAGPAVQAAAPAFQVADFHHRFSRRQQRHAFAARRQPQRLSMQKRLRRS